MRHRGRRSGAGLRVPLAAPRPQPHGRLPSSCSTRLVKSAWHTQGTVHGTPAALSAAPTQASVAPAACGCRAARSGDSLRAGRRDAPGAGRAAGTCAPATVAVGPRPHHGGAAVVRGPAGSRWQAPLWVCSTARSVLGSGRVCADDGPQPLARPSRPALPPGPPPAAHPPQVGGSALHRPGGAVLHVTATATGPVGSRVALPVCCPSLPWGTCSTPSGPLHPDFMPVTWRSWGLRKGEGPQQ